MRPKARPPTPRSRSAWIVALALVLQVPAAQAATGSAEPAGTTRIDSWVLERMAAHDIPGAAVAVVQGGRTIHLRGYGTADPNGRPVKADTPFLIGSASKPLTANIVLQLVDEGLLSLDEPVLPHIAHLTGAGPDGFEEVTVRHLLNHTAGLSMGVGLAGTNRIHRSEDALDRRVAELLSQPLAAPPGRFEYSNAGAMLLAAVIEQVTGDRFHQVLQDRIFGPMGMTDTFASEDHPAASRLATGHRLWFGRWRPSELPYDAAGVAMGYIGSSAQDLARFLHAHLAEQDSPSVPMSAAVIAEQLVVPTRWDIPFEANYGLGWFVDNLNGQPVVSHSGSLGDFTTHLIMVPGANGLGIAVLTNASAFITAGHEGQYDLSLGLARLLLGEQPEPAARSTLLAVVAPTIAWGLAVLLLGSIARFLTRSLPRWQQARTLSVGAKHPWIRHLAFPTVGYLGVAAALLFITPLGAARHFYPDVGWAATIIAYLALAWGLLRPVVTLAVIGSGRDHALF